MIVDTSKRDNSATEVKNGQTRLSRRIQGRRGPAGSGAAIFFRASVRGDGCWRHRLAALGGAVARAKGGSSAHGRSDKRGRAAHQRARNAGSRSGKGARDPKKIHGLLRERNGSLIEVIHSLKKAYPIASMCALVGVARSSYYAFARLRGERPHTTEVLDAARQIHTESRRNFGTRRMSRALRNQGYAVGRYRARTLMRLAQLKVSKHRIPRYRKAEGEAHIASNLLERRFEPGAINRVWAGDITYLR